MLEFLTSEGVPEAICAMAICLTAIGALAWPVLRAWKKLEKANTAISVAKLEEAL